MLDKPCSFSSVIRRYCDHLYKNTIRANMPQRSMEPCAISRPQSPVYMSHPSRKLSRSGRRRRCGECYCP